MRKVIYWVLIGLIGASGYFAFKEFKEYFSEQHEVSHALDLNRDLQSVVVQSDLSSADLVADGLSKPDIEDLGITIDFDELRNINSDIAGWLYIPDTYISFPILQETKVGEYHYLYHDYEGNRSSLGSIFTPAIPEGVEDSRLLLFGHRTKYEGIAFSRLYDLYSTESSGESYKTSYVIYPDKILKCELWCAVLGNTNDDVYKIPYILGSKEYAALLEGIKLDSSYARDISVTNQDKLLILSTCKGLVGGDERFYVVFKVSE